VFTSLIVIFIEQCELWHSAVFECCAQQWHSEIHRPLRFCMMHHPATLSHTAYSHRFCASPRVSSFQSISSRICISSSFSASLDLACFYLSLCNTCVSCSAVFYTLWAECRKYGKVELKKVGRRRKLLEGLEMLILSIYDEQKRSAIFIEKILRGKE